MPQVDGQDAGSAAPAGGFQANEALTASAALNFLPPVETTSRPRFFFTTERDPAGTRPNRRNPSRKLPALGGPNLITRNDCPSSCQSSVAPDLILNRSRNAFGTTVCPLLVTALVMVRISFFPFHLASQKISF
jgi:hypothetical protein